MTRSNRFFDIIQMLRQATRPLTAAQMAETLEVTKRTIYRDIAALQASRLPIEGEAGIGYVMRPGYDLPPLSFDAEEREALAVGLAMLGRTRDAGLKSAATRAAAKIAQVSPDTRHAADSLRVSDWTAMPDTKITAQDARQFIRAETQIDITYGDEAGRLTARRIDPIALIYFIDVAVMVAWCHLRQDFRHFRLDRIIDAIPTMLAFARPAATLRADWQARGQVPDFQPRTPDP